MGAILQKSKAVQALLALPNPHEQASMFGPALGPPLPNVEPVLPPSLADCPDVTRLFEALRNRGRNGRTCVPTLREGDIGQEYTRPNPSGASTPLGNAAGEDCAKTDTYVFCPPKDHVIRRIDIAQITSAQREAPLNNRRMQDIFTAIQQDKPIQPIRLHKDFQIANGFHRFFASLVLGYTQIDVLMPRRQPRT